MNAKSYTQSQTANPPINRVMQYQNPAVVRRLVKDGKFSESEASEVFTDTLRFLYVCGTCKGPFSPPPRIDIGWHTFLLHTAAYAEFCNRFFGRFIHHLPQTPDNVKADGAQVKHTISTAELVFGTLSENWEIPASGADCQQCCDGDC